jgi:transposase
MGRSRGGLTTKIHALVDAHGLPIRIKLTEGQAHDGASAHDMLGGLGKDCLCSQIAATIPMPCGH